jgi:hypothetical protein
MTSTSSWRRSGRALLAPENPEVDSRLPARRTTAEVAAVDYPRESNAGVSRRVSLGPIFATLGTRRVVDGPAGVAASSELRFGMNTGATLVPTMRSRQRLPIA